MKYSDNYWCAFAKVGKSSSVFVNKLYEYFGSIEQAWEAEPVDLYKVPNIQRKTIEEFIEERKKINPDECIDYINQRGIEFIHPESRNYPVLLREISNAPTGLFV